MEREIIYRAFDFFNVNADNRQKVFKAYKEPHRFYHNTDHILDMVDKIIENCESFSMPEQLVLVAAAVYHDIIYDVTSKTNEEDSAKLFQSHVGLGVKGSYVDSVVQIILDTKHTSPPRSTIGEIICNFDLSGLKLGDLNRLMTDERKIMLEYQQYEYSDYRKGRIEFLEGFLKTNNRNETNIRALIDVVKNRVLNIGVYAGSFNPFHKGHLNILQKAEKVFDKVIIARGINPSKNNKQLQDWNFLTQYRQVEEYTTDLPTFLKSKENFAKVTLVRGLRNGEDLEFEMNQLNFINDIEPGISTVFFTCDKEFQHISSSAIRELKNFNTKLSTHAEQYYK